MECNSINNPHTFNCKWPKFEIKYFKSEKEIPFPHSSFFPFFLRDKTSRTFTLTNGLFDKMHSTKIKSAAKMIFHVYMLVIYFIKQSVYRKFIVVYLWSIWLCDSHPSVYCTNSTRSGICSWVISLNFIALNKIYINIYIKLIFIIVKACPRPCRACTIETF